MFLTWSSFKPWEVDMRCQFHCKTEFSSCQQMRKKNCRSWYFQNMHLKHFPSHSESFCFGPHSERYSCHKEISRLQLHGCSTYLLHSLIFPVSSSSWVLCLLESLILSSFWKPFLDAKGEYIKNKLINILQIIHKLTCIYICLNYGTYLEIKKVSFFSFFSFSRNC